MCLIHYISAGFHTKEECDRYYKYLMGTRKQQYAADTTVWRSPPKLPVRPKQFQRRPRAQEEVEETRRVNTGYYRGQKSKGKRLSLKNIYITSFSYLRIIISYVNEYSLHSLKLYVKLTNVDCFEGHGKNYARGELATVLCPRSQYLASILIVTSIFVRYYVFVVVYAELRVT